MEKAKFHRLAHFHDKTTNSAAWLKIPQVHYYDSIESLHMSVSRIKYYNGKYVSK